jgi:hypothetical protein
LTSRLAVVMWSIPGRQDPGTGPTPLISGAGDGCQGPQARAPSEASGLTAGRRAELSR